MTLEQSISEVIAKKLNDGTIEKLVEEKMVNAIDSAIQDVFRWGDGEKAIKKKISEVMVPVIEKHDFNDYTLKLDAALTEIIKNTSLVENKPILESVKGLMTEPDKEVVKLSEIWEKYKEYVAANVDTDELEAICDGGDPSYEYVEVNMDTDIEEYKYFSSASKHADVVFTCEHDKKEELEYTLKLWKGSDDDYWRISGARFNQSVDFNSLRNLSDFEIFLIRLDRAFCKIEMDVQNESDEIEPDETPEWDLR